MLRIVSGFLVGIVVLGVLVATLQAFGAALHPVPTGLDPTDPADAQAYLDHLAGMPSASWVIGVFSELVGAFAGAWIAGWIAASRARIVSGAVIGLAFLGSVYNWTAFHHPAWFIAVQLVGYPLALVAVWGLLGRRDTRPAP